MKRDLLSIAELEREDLLEILDEARRLKRQLKRGEPHEHLRGKSLAMIFEKPSTRTRVSFEVGMFQLGGHSVALGRTESQLGRGETPADTARVLSRYVDGIVIRTFAQSTVDDMARAASVPVVNALTDLLHPCQVLADLFTLRERGKELGRDLPELNVAWIGAGNNMANSWIEAAAAIGFRLTLACPPSLPPDAGVLGRARERVKQRGHGELRVEVVRDPVDAVRDADAVNTDTWVSMGEEDGADALRRELARYQVNAHLLEGARPDALVLHCLPAHRGEEITDDVMDGRQSVVLDQAENRLHVAKAVLKWCMGTR
jgi:ornithine carbamoyltransferase